MSYKKADIYVNNTKAGVLEETESVYRFQYDHDYLIRDKAEYKLKPTRLLPYL